MPRRSIAVFCYRETEPRFLLLRRVKPRGGGWQPVTGRVEEADSGARGGDSLTGRHARFAKVIAGPRRAREPNDALEREELLAAALREIAEEAGLDDVLTVVDLGLESTFRGYDGAEYHERAFAAEVPDDAEIRISAEHDEARWVTIEQALALLQWEENREAILRLSRFLDAEETPEDGADEAPMRTWTDDQP